MDKGTIVVVEARIPNRHHRDTIEEAKRNIRVEAIRKWGQDTWVEFIGGTQGHPYYLWLTRILWQKSKQQNIVKGERKKTKLWLWKQLQKLGVGGPVISIGV